MSKAKVNEESRRLVLARQLVAELESGDDIAANKVLDDLTNICESDLFKEVGRMTRELHDAIVGFACDTRVAELTEDELPDAKDRLNHVISMTEKAADQTLSAVEAFMPLCKEMKDQSERLSHNWQRFLEREMPLTDFRNLAEELKGFLPLVEGNSSRVYDISSQVLLAQDFQDLTGQIIRRVIKLLEEMQEKLVNLLRVAGEKQVGKNTGKKQSEMAGEDIGPHVLGRLSNDAVSGQDDVDDLLSSLGF